MAKKFQFNWSTTVEKIKDQQTGNKNSFKDERIYFPKWQDNGTAEAIIRFLPSKDTDIPWVAVYSHSVKGNGWFIENCPTTIKNQCPVCDANSESWNSGDERTARVRKRKLNYYSNILVVKDPANPANEGKVFLYKYGKKIHDKIMAKLDPEGGIRKPVMVFDYYDGANFALVVKKVKADGIEMPNYDESAFEDVGPIGNDDEIEKVHASLFSLQEWVNPDKFKDFETLKEKFEKVTGVKGISSTKTTKPQKETTQTSKSVVSEDVDDSTPSGTFDGDDDDFFASLQSETTTE